MHSLIRLGGRTRDRHDPRSSGGSRPGHRGVAQPRHRYRAGRPGQLARSCVPSLSPASTNQRQNAVCPDRSTECGPGFGCIRRTSCPTGSGRVGGIAASTSGTTPTPSLITVITALSEFEHTATEPSAPAFSRTAELPRSASDGTRVFDVTLLRWDVSLGDAVRADLSSACLRSLLL